jgi:hypothetical protein
MLEAFAGDGDTLGQLLNDFALRAEPSSAGWRRAGRFIAKGSPVSADSEVGER